MKVVEVFESIQGEGFHQGYWCTFVRLAGCNLDCPWCDEQEHKDKSKIKDVDPEKLAADITTQTIVVTGGEPTLQAEELKRFLKCFLNDTLVIIESNGTADPVLYEELFDLDARIVVSPKPQARFKRPPLKYIACLKYVVDDDFWRWVHAEGEKRFEEEAYFRDMYLQPCDSADSEAIKTSAERILELCKQYQLALVKAGIQMHKVYSKMIGKEVK